MHGQPPLDRLEGPGVGLLVTAFAALAIPACRHLRLAFDEFHPWRHATAILSGDAARFGDGEMPVSAASAAPGKL